MSLDQFPFMPAFAVALFAHVICFMVARLLEVDWKGDTFLNRWWDPATTARLFTVKRADIRHSATWVFIVASRIALVLGGVFFLLACLTS